VVIDFPRWDHIMQMPWRLSSPWRMKSVLCAVRVNWEGLKEGQRDDRRLNFVRCLESLAEIDSSLSDHDNVREGLECSS
jgi:hypothetical protein